MKINYLSFSFVLCALVLLGCKKDDPKPQGGDDPDNPTTITSGAIGQLSDLSVGADGKWYAAIDQSWCQLSQMAGEGKQTVQLNTVYNRTPEKRTATVSVYAGSATKRNSAPIQTFTVTQEANNEEQIPAHFTDVKFEDGKLFFKLWTGLSGPIGDVDGSCTRYYGDGNFFIDNTLAAVPNTETDWKAFNKVVFSDNHWGKILVGEYPTLNSIRIEQSHTLKKLSDSPLQGSAAVHFVFDGKLYYGGGFSSATWVNSTIGGERYEEEPVYDFYCFDPNTQTSSKLADLPFSGGRATVLNGTPYALSDANVLYSYNISENRWGVFGTLFPGETVVAFYAKDGSLYLVGSDNRYEYGLEEKEFKLKNTHSNGAHFTKVDVAEGLDGDIWLCSANTIYQHTNSGYTQFATFDDGYMLGVHKGEIYIHSANNDSHLQKIDASGQIDPLELFFSISEHIGNNRYATPQKYAANIDGVFYIFGGAQQGYSSNINRKTWSYSNNMFRLNAAGYAPAGFLLVTD